MPHQDELKKRMNRRTAAWQNECFRIMDDFLVNTIPNHNPLKKDVFPKDFLQIIFAAKWLVRHSSTHPPNSSDDLCLLSSVCYFLYGQQETLSFTSYNPSCCPNFSHNKLVKSTRGKAFLIQPINVHRKLTNGRNIYFLKRIFSFERLCFTGFPKVLYYVNMIYEIIATDDCLSTFFSLKVATCLLYNIFIFYSKLKKYKYFLDSVRILYPAATRITIHVLLLLF